MRAPRYSAARFSVWSSYAWNALPTASPVRRVIGRPLTRRSGEAVGKAFQAYDDQTEKRTAD